MRKKITSQGVMRLAKTATILSIGSLAAGCSSDVIRFSDGFYTGAIPQPNEVSQQASADYGQPNFDPNVDRGVTGSIGAQPVQRMALPRPSEAHLANPQPAASVAAATPPALGAAAPGKVSSMTTASISRSTLAEPDSSRFSGSATPGVPSAKTTKEGWTTAGATHVTLREGETIYNLARRYGVPANAITEANGISDPKSVAAGQRILIPTYVYSRTTGVSTPDRNPATRAASSTVGNRNSAALARAPAPQIRPAAQTAAAPQRAAVTADGGRYTVAAGDTLSAISRRTGASVAAIKQVNSMSSDTVRIGQKLIIPGLTAPEKKQVASATNVDPVTTGTVKPQSDSKQPVAGYTPPKQPAKTTEGSITRIETQASAKAPDATGVSAMRWPVQGRVVNAFGSNNGGKPNDGIDISVPNGTPVKAAENGVVIYAGDGLKELGKTVLVRHSDGVVTVYGHVSDIDVKRGDTVKRGQQIAASGMSGSAKQPQLHFEVRKNSAPVNPVKYLQ